MNSHVNDVALFEMKQRGGEGLQASPLSADRLGRAKVAYSVRRVPLPAIETLITGEIKPRPGDLVLARVDRLGQHPRLELVTGRRATLYAGDEIVVCYGNRYAPDQFESRVPDHLGSCHLVAGGGVASQMLSKHQRVRRPTSITPIGLLGDHQSRPINLADWALVPQVGGRKSGPFTVAVVGTAMNAGKTTAAAHLIRGLSISGLKVAACKVTGTGSGCDPWLMLDSGATAVVDFTDAGYASTFGVPLAELVSIVTTLTGHLAAEGVDAIVMEVADGLVQAETAALLQSAVFARAVDGVIFAANDAMGAKCGIEWLGRYGMPVLGVSGTLTASPLARHEAELVTGLPVFGLEDLSNPDIGSLLACQAGVASLAAAV